MQWHQLDHMQTICTSLQTDNHTDTSSLNFYRPDAPPDTLGYMPDNKDRLKLVVGNYLCAVFCAGELLWCGV